MKLTSHVSNCTGSPHLPVLLFALSAIGTESLSVQICILFAETAGLVLTKASSIGRVIVVGGGTIAMVVYTAVRVLDRNTLATIEAMMIATYLARDLAVQSKVAFRTEAVHVVFRCVFPKDLIR